MPFETVPGRVVEPDRTPPTGGRAPTTHPPRHCRPEHDTPRAEPAFDPWAEDEPVFGRRGTVHALSQTPGTPPGGNLAVPRKRSGPRSDSPPTPSAKRDLEKTDASLFAFGDAGADEAAERSTEPELAELAQSVRVEMETGRPGNWICGLCDRASGRGAELSLRSAAWSGFALPAAGTRVRLLVSPTKQPAFTLTAKVVPTRGARARPGDFRVALVIDTNDTVALTRWQTVIERAGG